MSDPIKSYRDLIAWQRAFSLGKRVYAVGSTFPEHERFGLIASVRRLSTSIASQIAQGYGKGNTHDYVWHLKAARGDLYQLDPQLLFALDFKHLDEIEYQSIKHQLDEAERVLAGLIRSLTG